MRKFLTGLFSGVILTALIALAYLNPWSGDTNARQNDPKWLVDARDNNPHARYQYPRAPAGAMMDIEAEFIDPVEGHILYSSPFSLIRIEPVHAFVANDFDKICITSIGRYEMNIGAKLRPHVRDKMAADLMRSDDIYTLSGLDSDNQHFMFASGVDELVSFSVNDVARKHYKEFLADWPNEFDFVMKVPFGNLYDFQYVLRNGVAFAPLKGCSDDVDLSQLPGWETMINETWGY